MALVRLLKEWKANRLKEWTSLSGNSGPLPVDYRPGQIVLDWLSYSGSVMRKHREHNTETLEEVSLTHVGDRHCFLLAFKVVFSDVLRHMMKPESLFP